MPSLGKDIAAEVSVLHALNHSSATAGGAGDNTEVNGVSLNQANIDAQSVAFVIDATATLVATKTLIVTANLQDSADGSTWVDITTPAVVMTLTGAGGGSTETGIAKIGYDLTSSRQYVRLQATPDLSNTVTDTAKIAAVAVLGGASELPAA